MRGEERRAYRVVGRVQGVGFRWWTRSLAIDLGLRGSVRNAADGSVVIEAAGEPEALTRFEEHLQQGPRSAHVAAVHSLDPPTDLPNGFEIGR